MLYGADQDLILDRQTDRQTVRQTEGFNRDRDRDRETEREREREREIRDSHSADETVEHLVFQCPAHDHARRDSWPGDTFTTDPRRLWSYLERIGAVTPPRPGMREREREEKEMDRRRQVQHGGLVAHGGGHREWCRMEKENPCG